jgi:hypothetical protein
VKELKEKMKMIIKDTVIDKGNENQRFKELDISNGSHLFYRDADGKETFKEWDELDEETQRQLSELAGQAEGIVKRGLRE